MDRVDEIIRRAENIDSKGFLGLVEEASALLRAESGFRVSGGLVTLPPKGKVTVVGDLHGDLLSLRRILEICGFLDVGMEDSYLIFLGDYGDRGFYSPEVYSVILELKIMFPDRIILLRGNHEGPDDLLAYPHDLPWHLRRKFGGDSEMIYEGLRGLFRSMYLAVLVEGRFVMLHGGVPSMAGSIEDLMYADEKHPAESHLEEILWSDPVEDLMGTYPSPRGAGKLFGEDVTCRFLRLLDVDLLIRGHEPADSGFKMNHDGRVVTLFSRRGAPYHNRFGAFLQTDLSREIKDRSEIKNDIIKF